MVSYTMYCRCAGGRVAQTYPYASTLVHVILSTEVKGLIALARGPLPAQNTPVYSKELIYGANSIEIIGDERIAIYSR